MLTIVYKQKVLPSYPQWDALIILMVSLDPSNLGFVRQTIASTYSVIFDGTFCDSLTIFQK